MPRHLLLLAFLLLFPLAAGAAQVHGDFNGDGIADLAIGVPNEDVGTVGDAGAVNVLYGTATGLSGSNYQIWTQDSPGVEDVAEAFDLFGYSLAAGDFNGDGFDDLAVGMVGEDVAVFQGTAANAGAINVLYGSAAGLTGGSFWHQNSNIRNTAVDDIVEVGDGFGACLTTGDFNGDGFDDLAVGVPGESVGATANAGAVNILYGMPGGLLSDSFAPLISQFWHQNSSGIAESAEGGDGFGSSLAAADFGKDARDDLAIGVPGESVGANAGAGAVHVLYGSANGVGASGSQLWHQNSSGIADAAELVDGFGESLAAADFGKSAQADLAIGVPLENVGSVTNAGAVNIIYGTSTGLASAGNQFWHQNSSGIANSTAEGDQFGDALAAANFGKTAQADLAIGVPGETVGGAGAGAAHVLYGTSTGLSSSGSQYWHQNSSGVLDTAELLDQFGFALSAGNFGKTSHADLAVGVAGESIGAIGAAGAVNVIYGASTGLASSGNQFWHQNSSGSPDPAEDGDNFGAALAP
jgi:disulfide bond formation protein DsbB